MKISKILVGYKQQQKKKGFGYKTKNNGFEWGMSNLFTSFKESVLFR